MSWFRRDWTKIPPDSWKGRLFRWPLRWIPREVPLPILSGTCKGMKWTLATHIYSYWFGTYELDKQAALCHFLRPGMIVYDIGANAGFYTLLFSKMVGEEGHVYSFEPFPENTIHLRRHLELNKLNNVTVVYTAISNRKGEASFHVGENNSSGFITSADGDVKVPTISMDHFVEEGHRSPDLIKMDIEGGEVLALEGAPRVLSQTKAVWFIALHNQLARQRCGDILKASRYRTYRLDGKPLETLSEDIDEIYALPPTYGEG